MDDDFVSWLLRFCTVYLCRQASPYRSLQPVGPGPVSGQGLETHNGAASCTLRVDVQAVTLWDRSAMRQVVNDKPVLDLGKNDLYFLPIL
jgi:hypothetical protein